MNWYKLAKIEMPPEFWEGGKAVKEGVTEDDVDSDELASGIKVEKEHIDDADIAKKIALDHLAEIPDAPWKYYSALDWVEKVMGKMTKMNAKDAEKKIAELKDWLNDL